MIPTLDEIERIADMRRDLASCWFEAQRRKAERAELLARWGQPVQPDSDPWKVPA